MDFRILGPLEVIDEGKGVALRGDKQRALLALLLLHPNEALSADRLIHELWGEYPPATAGKSLQMHVSRVRAALAAGAGNGSHGDGPVLTRQHGYELRVDPECVDSHRFERLVGEGRRELSAGRPERAVWALESALLLWRGSPLADVAYESFAQHEIARLEALRVEAFEELIDAKLALGLHAELVGKLQVLVAEHPYEERLCRQLMLALYRSDRQADALQAYQDARSRLVEELGLEPGERLRELERAILKQDPALAAPASELPSRAPLSSGFGRANGLPSLPNPTIGRAGDVRAVVDRLRVDGVRLLTLTGPGGVGKTRLALEASRAAQGDFADGAHFVSLAALRRPEDLPGAIVNALAIAVLSGESADQAAERFLSAKHLLLVVDNCEHLLAAAPFIGSLLRTCPALTVLATSREPLGLQAEERCPVSPLTLPEPATPTGADALVGVDAVALFCARARAQDRDFDVDDANAPAVAEICRRVDGLPLAIELAAARCGLLSPDEIAERLQGTLGALGPGARDAPARQQTLRATIDWSYALLTEEEKQCFARFAVFARSATVEAAETITHARLDTLDGLVAKSLLVRARHTHTPTRLWMLDTVHAYAAERFVSAADVDTVHEDHCRYYLALAQRHGRERALWGADAPEHLARLDAETNNIQVALGWAVGQANAEQALAMAAALGRYWFMRNRYADAVDWVDQALDLPGADAHPGLRVRALCTKAWCLWPMGRGTELPAVAAEAEAIARGLGDPVILTQALKMRVVQELDAERLDAADAVAEEALDWARAAGDEWDIAEVSRLKAIAASGIADLRERVDTAASLLSEVGNVRQLADLLTSAAYSALCLDSERDAADFAARAVPLARALDEPFLWMMNRGNLGLAALLTGKTDTASLAFREELALCRDMVIRVVLFEGLRGMAGVAVMHGDDKRAATLIGAARAHRYSNPDDPVVARLDETFFKPARTRCGTGEWDLAEHEGSALSFEGAIAYALGESRA